MILVVNTCFDRLSELEFVTPITNILKNRQEKFLMKDYVDIKQSDLNKSDKTIICGTALKDLDYLKHLEKFNWLKHFEKPVLGICAGFQILANLFDGKLVEKTMIGSFKVTVVEENSLAPEREFYSYFMNSLAVSLNRHFVILAKSGKTPCIFKSKNAYLYGCLFHPEVLNPEILTNFCNKT